MNEPLPRCFRCGCVLEPQAGVACDRCREELRTIPELPDEPELIQPLLENGALND